MPLYEYQCDACGNRFERIQKFSDPPIETCPACEGTVRKLLSSPAIQFKGTGWYITDYARKSSSNGGSSSGSDGSSGGSKGDSSAPSTTTTSTGSGGAGSSGGSGGSGGSSGSGGSTS